MNPAGETTDVDRPTVGGRCVGAMSLLPDYARQAETYDQTRSASGPILAALQAAIAGARGGRLADIGGGTGNYALALEHEGWQPVAALAAYPEKVLEQRWRAQTSYFERLQRDHPAELDAGLQQIEADVAAGCATCCSGRASILAWTRGAERQ
jgi:hypothetical protein